MKLKRMHVYRRSRDEWRTVTNQPIGLGRRSGSRGKREGTKSEKRRKAVISSKLLGIKLAWGLNFSSDVIKAPAQFITSTVYNWQCITLYMLLSVPMILITYILELRVFSLAHRIAQVSSYVRTAEHRNRISWTRPQGEDEDTTLTICKWTQNWYLRTTFTGHIDECWHLRKEWVIVFEIVNSFNITSRSSNVKSWSVVWGRCTLVNILKWVGIVPTRINQLQLVSVSKHGDLGGESVFKLELVLPL